MQFAQIDGNGIYQRMVNGIEGDAPGAWYLPQGIRVSLLGMPPTDEPNTWRDNEITWVRVTQEDLKWKRISEIHARFVEIGNATSRPIRAILMGKHTDKDTDMLAALEAEAEALRDELQGLQQPIEFAGNMNRCVAESQSI